MNAIGNRILGLTLLALYVLSIILCDKLGWVEWVLLGTVTLGLFVGYLTGKFAVRLGSNHVAAIGKGDHVLYYLFNKEDLTEALRFLDEKIAQITSFKKIKGHARLKKAEALAQLAQYRTMLTSPRVRQCSGLLYRLTGYNFISWNPFVGLIRSDKRTGPFLVQFVQSPNKKFSGVDVPGPKDTGLVPVTVEIESQNITFVDLVRMFLIEDRTEVQINDGVRTAIGVICSEMDVDKLRKREYNEFSLQLAVTELVRFGILSGTFSIKDIDLSGSPLEAIVRDRALAGEKQELALAEKGIRTTNAESALIEKQKQNEGEADLITKTGDATAGAALAVGLAKARALHEQAQALGTRDPNAVRGVLGASPAGQLPTGVSWIHMGAGQGAEVWTEAPSPAGVKKKDKTPPSVEAAEGGEAKGKGGAK